MTWHCDSCSLDWPWRAEFGRCPCCGEVCSATVGDAMPDKEAAALVDQVRKAAAIESETQRKRREFEEQYAEREATRFREELDSWATAQLW